MKTGTRLPIARYRFSFRMESDLRLPEYAGSLLRGQFGAALRRSSCMTGGNDCRTCPLLRTCPYPSLFEAPPPPEGHTLQAFSHIPNAYIIEAPPFGSRGVCAGGCFEFQMVLIGHTLERLALIVHAWQRAFGHGLGRQRTRGLLESIHLLQPDARPVPVWNADTGTLSAHSAYLRIPAFPATGSVQLDFHTPLRLQHQSRILRPSELSPRHLIAQLLRRVTLLLECHAGIAATGHEATLVRSSETLRQHNALRWQAWTRYSSRQQQEMPFSGVCGKWILLGDVQPLLSWLWLGQWLHAGKNASFGLGGYHLNLLPEDISLPQRLHSEAPFQAIDKQKESLTPQ